MVVIFQLFLFLTLVPSSTKGYNVPQDYDLDTDRSNQIVNPDYVMTDDEFSEASESPEFVMPESDNPGQIRPDIADEYQLESMVFPDSDMNDDEFFEDTASVDLQMAESDAPEEIEQYIKIGYCHWEHSVWYKPEEMIRCNCLNCTCLGKGKWKCEYAFEFCPYYYCGNVQYNPYTKLCCYGKVHTKKPGYNCCGHAYYNSTTSKCCEDSTILPLKINCPHHRF